MNTKDLLLKLAGNDATKQKRAEQWANLFWCCRMDLTEAQGKVLLNEPCVPEEAGTVFALCWAINLREPVFLKTAIDILWDTPAHDGLALSKVLDVLNEDAQRQLLKTPDTFKSLMVLINEVEHYRDNVPEYVLWCPNKSYDINSIYRAAWYVVDYHCCYDPIITERYSLKKLKAALKTPERIDRYAQIEHVEYDYSTGCLGPVRHLVETARIPEFEPIWFKTSEDIAAEGALMNNCIAGYWNRHGDCCCVFACIYKGTRIDVEISGNLRNVGQCYKAGNRTSELTIELAELLQAALNPPFDGDFIYTSAGTTVHLYDPFGFGELEHKCIRFSATRVENSMRGRYLVDTDTLVVFRISTVGRNTLKAVDISYTEEGLAVRGWFCNINNITDDDCFDDEGFDAAFIDFFDDFD